ncbi:hypothetical protein [Robiginitalea marina]|uniref:Apea-like HEPN domain-containing protein n=1 Tax=Robiginitalea marina TaxID=2954105 RepID=A0ABT1AY83_9FLAO|nr:hypothetical protein [Robiginitalea marina]MCO5724990.1 hypothetical protein [Robiginitalea marina]
MSALRIFKKESIMNAGIRLASKLSNQYLNKTPEQFFRYCYSLRSKLIHGSIPGPKFNKISTVIGALETFTADLILLFPLNE